MQVVLAPDRLLIELDILLYEELIKLNHLMISCGIFDSERRHTPREKEYQDCLRFLLDFECDDSFRAVVVLDYEDYALIKGGLTWLWIQRYGKTIKTYNRHCLITGSAVSASFLDVIRALSNEDEKLQQTLERILLAEIANTHKELDVSERA